MRLAIFSAFIIASSLPAVDMFVAEDASDSTAVVKVDTAETTTAATTESHGAIDKATRVTSANKRPIAPARNLARWVRRRIGVGRPYPKLTAPGTLREILWPTDGKQTLSEAEKGERELQAYLEDEQYQRFMNAKIKEAAGRLPAGEVKDGYMKMTINQLVDKWRKENPKMTSEQLALQLAVLESGSSSVLGTMHPEVCKEASLVAAQAAKEARFYVEKESGHNVSICACSAHGDNLKDPWFHLNPRANRLTTRFHRAGYQVRAPENEAVGSLQMAGYSLMEHAEECVSSWNGSPGHKLAMDAFHTYACHSMAKNSRGVFHCFGNFVDQIPVVANSRRR